jgi:seryl-tRNA synthetase
MIDIKKLQADPEFFKKSLKNKNHDPNMIDEIIALDTKRRELNIKVQDLRSQKNKFTESKDIENATKIKKELSALEPELKKIEEEYKTLLWSIPNPAAADVPIGPDESSNVSIKTWGQIPSFDFTPLDHVEIGKKLKLIELEKASEISGARFAYMMGDAVLLEFALVQFVFSILTNQSTLTKIAKDADLAIDPKPFIPVVPPVMIRPDIFDQMARKNPPDERYYIPSDDLFLVGSAEHTLGPLHLSETLQEKNLPIRYIGFSTCFRREAGSYGKDTKGILRLHQFDKLEMQTFSLPENGENEQKFLVAIQEYLVQALKIPYQLVQICTGDMGAPDVRQYDIECYLPGQNQYRETHTSDWMGDYQTRRMGIRVKRDDGATEFVHTNDATTFAIGRTLIAILENYQQADGSVVIPEVLRPWIGKDKITL